MKALALMTLLSTFVTLSADAHTVTGAEVVDFGTFEAVRYATPTAPRTASGKINRTKKERLIAKTTKIEASPGIRFGIRFKLAGEPYGEVVSCTTRVIHPKLTNPRTGRTTEIDEWQDRTRIGYITYTGYRFDSPWELVPGEWKIQVLHGATVVAEKAFQISVRGGTSNEAVE